MLVPDYTQALSRSSLPHKDILSKLPRQAINLLSERATDEELSAGASKLGGFPDLPPGFQWPYWQGKPQSFIAQINLSELPRIEQRDLLPDRGLMLFFYDSERLISGIYQSEKDGFAVFHITDPVLKILPNELPEDLEQISIYDAAKLDFTLGMTEPGWEHPILERIGLTFEECLMYGDVVNKERQLRNSTFRRTHHQILGYPNPIQTPVAWDCERARHDYWKLSKEKQRAIDSKIRQGVDDWELLLQVDEDQNARMEWPLSGRIYYMIRRQGLGNRRFDLAWFILQCT